jgi:hypothetical protein
VAVVADVALSAITLAKPSQSISTGTSIPAAAFTAEMKPASMLPFFSSAQRFSASPMVVPFVPRSAAARGEP